MVERGSNIVKMENRAFNPRISYIERREGGGRASGLVFDKVCVDVEDKRILWSVSGKAVPGQMLAIIGPSGKCGFVITRSDNSSSAHKSPYWAPNNIEFTCLLLVG